MRRVTGGGPKPHEAREAGRAETNLSWLVKLRWGAIAAESALVLVVDRTTIALPIVQLFAVLAVVLASNVGLVVLLRAARGAPERIREQHVGATLAFDVVALTVMLAFTGGPLNPFSSLYLVYIALASAVLGTRWIWTLVGLSAASFAILYVDSMSRELGAADHATHMRIHLKGMWLSFMVAALFIGYFVNRVQRALSLRELELAQIRAQQARGEKLAALATLAAGAAHELSTPLSTIAVVAKELAVALQKARVDPALVEDASLIREEVARCRTVLDQLAADAGGSVGDEPAPIPLDRLVALSCDGLAPSPRIDAHVDERAATVRVPVRAVALAMRGVIKNAQDASPADGEVVVRAATSGEQVRIEVRDRGAGMDPATLARVGEPFFTTKEPGRGMGLGLFLTRSVLEHLHGDLRIDSEPGRGTTVVLSFPADVLS